ncbi:interleukin-1 receptor-like 2 isoform X3 [Ovis aries]|uniref:interleukin-1 receptor-like 2 isoform X3 n=2 Tax=Ovis TaxID=9935 RepID=UPI001C2E98B6|nr:interleukin-1 receptor-like 2 isoform X3 [Ovis aries]
MRVNLTVFEKYWCGASGNSQLNMPHEYKQILQVGRDDILICHLNFPNNFYLDSVKWYKDCIEIEGERFISRGKKLLVKNVSVEDRGNYECQASLTHAKKQHTVFNSISVTVTEKVGSGGRIPKIIYPKNNSIEVKLGSMLIVNCNITDTRDNTNPRCWRVNNTLVDDYYGESKRIQEGIENYTIFPEHIFYTVNITFLEVKMEDYGRPFMCHAGVSAAFFILKLPVPDFQAYLIGGLLILTGAVVSAMCIYNIFKIDIVLWYRSSFHSAGPIEDGKLYDAYVLYPKPQRESQSHDVDTLVLKILPEVLEKQCGYKLFIFGRDEFPGQAVVNVIDENIRLCRRLIIVIDPDELSFDLLKNLSEEQIAVYSALIQDGIKVILIELGKVKDYTALPESIQYIKQKHGAVRWSGDFTEQSQCAKTKFWKKVRYHMPPKRWPPSCPAAEAHAL